MTLTLMVCYVPCDFCGAERGERCRTADGRVRWSPHGARERAAHRRQLETIALKSKENASGS